MMKYGYRQCKADHILFVKCQDDRLSASVVYLDDIVVTRNDAIEMRRLKK